MRSLLMPILALFATAAAAENQSAYTKITDEKCRVAAEYEAGATSLCEGHAGVWFRIDDGDARVSVIFGVDPDEPVDSRPWFESFENFNNINDVIEWRHRGDDKPFAAILRWLISISRDGGANYKTGQVLVVSRVGDGAGSGSRGCVVGYVDALVNGNANQMAREIADTLAADFRCGVDEPAWHGETGRLSSRPMRSVE